MTVIYYRDENLKKIINTIFLKEGKDVCSHPSVYEDCLERYQSIGTVIKSTNKNGEYDFGLYLDITKIISEPNPFDTTYYVRIDSKQEEYVETNNENLSWYLVKYPFPLMSIRTPKDQKEIEVNVHDILKKHLPTRELTQELASSHLSTIWFIKHYINHYDTTYTKPERHLVRRYQRYQPKWKTNNEDYYILELDKPKRFSSRSKGDEESHKRYHLCRGHYRMQPYATKDDYERIWIKPHWKGDEKLGRINKDYKL